MIFEPCFEHGDLVKGAGGVQVLAVDPVLSRLEGEKVHSARLSPFVDYAVGVVFFTGIFLAHLHILAVVICQIDKVVGLKFAVKIVLLVKAFNVLAVEKDERAPLVHLAIELLLRGAPSRLDRRRLFDIFVLSLLVRAKAQHDERGGIFRHIDDPLAHQRDKRHTRIFFRHVLGKQDGLLRNRVEDKDVLAAPRERARLFESGLYHAEHGVIYGKRDDRDDEKRFIDGDPAVSEAGEKVEKIRPDNKLLCGSYAAESYRFEHGIERFAERGVRNILIVSDVNGEPDGERAKDDQDHEHRPAHARIASRISPNGKEIDDGADEHGQQAHPDYLARLAAACDEPLGIDDVDDDHAEHG